MILCMELSSGQKSLCNFGGIPMENVMYEWHDFRMTNLDQLVNLFVPNNNSIRQHKGYPCYYFYDCAMKTTINNCT